MAFRQSSGQGYHLRLNLAEFGGAFGDIGTMLPVVVALVLVNGLNTTWVLVLVGLFYIGSGLYFRTPMPVQPLKALSVIAISTGLPASVIGASGLLIGAILLFLAFTNIITRAVKLFPHAVVRGIQLGIGLTLVVRGKDFVLGEPALRRTPFIISGFDPVKAGIILAALTILIFVIFKYAFPRQAKPFPPSLAVLTFGVSTGIIFNPIAWPGNVSITAPDLILPGHAEFWLAFTTLVVPQLPLTLGNAVVGTWDTAHTYFGDGAKRVTPRALAASMGLANIAAGLTGAMPMCHGSGGLTAHYKLGARTPVSNLVIGGILLALGLVFGRAALPMLSLIPLSVLGSLLVIIGVYHSLLVRDLKDKEDIAIAAIVGGTTIILGNLAIGFIAGLLLYYLLKLAKAPAKVSSGD